MTYVRSFLKGFLPSTSAVFMNERMSGSQTSMESSRVEDTPAPFKLTAHFNYGPRTRWHFSQGAFEITPLTFSAKSSLAAVFAD